MAFSYSNIDLTLKRQHLAQAVFGFAIGTLIFTFLFYNEPDWWLTYSHVILMAAFVGVVLAYLVTYISRFLSNLTNWSNQPGWSLLVLLVINTTVVYLITSGYLWFYKQLDLDHGISDDVNIKLGIISFITVLLYSVVRLVINSYRLLQQNLLDSVHLETRQNELQLAALKSQLTPHFLFNSLNTISSLIHKSPELMEGYIRNLARVYEYTLPGFNQKVVSFRDEWQYVNANQELMRERFGQHLTIELIDEPQLLEIQMPPLTLQLLIENVMKHNRIDAEHLVKVCIERKGNWWQVSNNITDKPNHITSFHIGLDNIKERYLLLAKKAPKVVENELFTVKLPVL